MKTIVAVGKELVLHILSLCFSLSYPACSAHAPHCHPWPARLCSIFPHYLINNKIFEIKVVEHKMCFDFLYNFCLKLFSF